VKTVSTPMHYVLGVDNYVARTNADRISVRTLRTAVSVEWYVR